MPFCDKCGSLITASGDCRGCKQKKETIPLEQKIREAFRMDDRLRPTFNSEDIAELYKAATKNSEYVRGKLMFQGSFLGMAVMHPSVLAAPTEDINKGFRVDREFILSPNYGSAAGQYYVQVFGDGRKKVSEARVNLLRNPNYVSEFQKAKPFTKFILVPEDFNL